MEKTYIFGHHNPDTDSVGAAIALSYYKNAIGMNTEPRILDEINKETEFVLNYFDVSCPLYLDNVKLQIRDVKYHNDYYLKNTDSIKKVYDFLIDKSITGLPIVDDNQKFVGLITLKMIIKKLFDDDLRHVCTSYDNLLEVLNGEELSKFSSNVDGDIVTISSDSYSFDGDNDILITSCKNDVINDAIDSGVKNIIIVGDGDISLDFDSISANIIRTNYDIYYTLKLISLANYSELFCDRKSTVVNENDFYDDFVDLSKKLKHNNYPVVDDEFRCLGLLRLTDLDNLDKKRVILVDHNESGQSVTGLSQADIVEIVDHHKIGDLTTSFPINFRNMAVGSSNTIVYQLFMERSIDIPDYIAGIMLSGILSDTLILKSPTTTSYDRDAVIHLAKIAGVDYEKYGFEMFKAGTSLEGKTKKEIINTDIKAFNFDDEYKYAVSQIFTLDIDSIIKDIDSYIELIENMKNENGYKFIVVAITDIIKNGSYFIFTESAQDVLEAGYGIKNIEQGQYIEDQVSRKKQIVPSLITGINRLR